MTTYHLYSDCSINERAKIVGLAYLITYYHNKQLCIKKKGHCKGSAKIKNTTEGEMCAAIEGLKQIESGNKVVLHTDLNHLSLDALFNKFGKHVNKEIINEFYAQIKRFNTHISYRPKESRTTLYEWCHHSSRIESFCNVDRDRLEQINNDVQLCHQRHHNNEVFVQEMMFRYYNNIPLGVPYG